MSLYGTAARSKPAGPKPVWPYYFLSVSAILLALLACIVYWPKDIPPQDDLVMTGGKMRTLMVRDDFSNTGAGAMLPILTSVYLRFKDIEGEFRYPWTFPQYGRVRNDTAVYVDIWVAKSALGGDKAPLIWALREKNHYKDNDEQTVVLYEDLVENQRKNGITLIKLSMIMAGAS
nr:hypothetical protein [Rhodospirillaceae bacterium]